MRKGEGPGCTHDLTAKWGCVLEGRGAADQCRAAVRGNGDGRAPRGSAARRRQFGLLSPDAIAASEYPCGSDGSDTIIRRSIRAMTIVGSTDEGCVAVARERHRH